MPSNDREWDLRRLRRVEEQILELEDIETKILSGKVYSYTLDTGQTRESVTRHNITELRKYIEALENRRATLLAKLRGSSFVGRPAY